MMDKVLKSGAPKRNIVPSSEPVKTDMYSLEWGFQGNWRCNIA
jgi:hypothetical protein